MTNQDTPKNILWYKINGAYLNKREVECIRYLIVVVGDDMYQIAKQLKLSVRTVAFYVKSAMLKLNCKNLQELIAQVRKSDLIRDDELV